MIDIKKLDGLYQQHLADHIPDGTKMIREWVGLTEDEIEEVWGEPVDLMYSKHYDAIRAIEAKLKEKNG